MTFFATDLILKEIKIDCIFHAILKNFVRKSEKSAFMEEKCISRKIIFKNVEYFEFFSLLKK